MSVFPFINDMLSSRLGTLMTNGSADNDPVGNLPASMIFGDDTQLTLQPVLDTPFYNDSINLSP